jgi:NTP pyrophosphatase (non-canonical NTP hydrolase)
VTSPSQEAQKVLGYSEEDVTSFRQAFAALCRSAQRDSDQWFPETSTDLGHIALALGGEVGEVQNIVKKIERGTDTLENLRGRLRDELADVFTYFLDVCFLVDADILYDYFTKHAFNDERFSK